MRSRPIAILILLASLALVLAACTTADDDDVAEAADDSVAETTDDAGAEAEATDDEAPDGTTNGDLIELPDDFEPFETPDLDIETLQAEFPDGPVDAEPYRNTWVGEITDEIFIGISLDSRYTGREQGVAVYLCDSEDVGIYLTGELDSNDEATLVEEGAEVTLALVDGEFTGTVTLAGQDPVTFTAEAAVDSAGLYIAEHEADEVEMTGRWIVLADGSQRGFVFCCVIIEHPGCIPCRAQN